VPHIEITIPSGAVVGRTVEAQIGTKPERVTLLNEKQLRIEADGEVCRIIAATSQDGKTSICAISRRAAERR
jgi:hypothetical protein